MAGTPPPPPNLDLDRGGNAFEGFYATNTQLQLVSEALVTHLANAFIGTDAEKVVARDALVAAATTARDTARRVTVLTQQNRAKVSDEQIPLMTRLPDFTVNANHNVDILPDRRDIRMPKPFTGKVSGSTPEDVAIKCRAFLAQLMDIIVTNRLSELGSKRLLKLNSGDDLALIVNEMIDANATLEEIIRKIEVMYGGLKTPEQAQMECHKTCRYPGEAIMTLGRRIKQLAFMATRLKQQPQKAMEELARETFLSVISLELKQQIKLQERERVALGQKPLDYETLVSEAKKLEDIRATELMIIKSRNSHRDTTIRAVTEDPFSLPDQYYSDTPLVREAADEGAVQVVNQNWRANKPNDKKQYFRKRFPYANRKGRNDRGIRHLEAEGGEEDEYEYSDDELNALDAAGIDIVGSILYVPAYNGAKKEFIRVSPRELKVTPDLCMKCGLPGHRAFGPQSEKCPLKNQPLVTKPCSFCGKGGHLPNLCPKRK